MIAEIIVRAAVATKRFPVKMRDAIFLGALDPATKEYI